jgi:putative addiction module component (TIGR02574 family)
MSDPVEELSRKARALPPEDRARLAEELLASLQQDRDPDIEAAWDEEIRRRIAEIENGTATLVPAEQVFAEVSKLFK